MGKDKKGKKRVATKYTAKGVPRVTWAQASFAGVLEQAKQRFKVEWYPPFGETLAHLPDAWL